VVSFIDSNQLFLSLQLVEGDQGVSDCLQLVTGVPSQVLHQAWPAWGQTTNFPAGLQDGAGHEAGHHQHHALFLQPKVHHLLDSRLQILLDCFKIVNILPVLLVSRMEGVGQQQLCQVAAGGEADVPLEEAQHHKPREEDYEEEGFLDTTYSKLRKADNERGSGRREINLEPRGMLLS
jgi:hypothetical protein